MAGDVIDFGNQAQRLNQSAQNIGVMPSDMAPPIQPSLVDKIFDKESILEDLKQMLRGYSFEWRKQTNKVGTEFFVRKWVNLGDQEREPYLNEQGINKIMLMLKPITSNEIKASKIKNDVITLKYIEFKRELADTLYLNHEEYGVSPNDYKDIIQLVGDFYHMILFSIEDGRLLKLIVTNITEHHEYSGMQQQGKKSWIPNMGFLGNWTKRNNSGGMM